jgi:hypothetical protein
MPHRRALFTASGAVGIGLVPGCVGFVTGTDAVERSAESATLSTPAPRSDRIQALGNDLLVLKQLINAIDY